MKLGSTLTLLGVVVKWSSARVTNPETRESVSLATSTSSSIQQRDVLSDLLNDAKNLTTCSACESLLVVLQGLAHLGNKDFVNVITSFCQDLHVEDPDVCAGAIGLEGPILAHDLRQMKIGSDTSKLFCLTVFGLCPWPSIDTSYDLSLTPKPNTVRPAPSGKTPLKVAHFSDIHVDLSYTPGASYNCTKNICCRPYEQDDEPGVTDYPAGPYGNPACDSPLSLEQSMYEAINQLAPSRSFSIFTGDVVEGAVWLVTDAEVTNDLNNASSNLASTLGGKVYPVVGNHDAAPVNSFPPAAVDTTITTQWAYDTLSSDWATWIGSQSSGQVSSNFGSYAVQDPSGLKIISVNTNFWYKQNFWLFEEPMEHDPSGTLAWLVSELEAAESAGQRVWILGHMPMGSGDTLHEQSYYFDQIIQRYEATIAAVFYGHTHKDEFEIAYSDYTNQAASTATMMSYIAPALTPTSGNPSFRVYDVDPVTFGVLDVHVYYTNISSPTYQNGPKWELLYSVKETYGSLLGYTDPAAELTPAFWHNVTALFESNDAVFQQYIGRKSRDYDLSTCDGDCKTTEICQLRAAQAQYNCVTVSPGVHFKRDLHGALRAGECDGSKAIPILSAMTSPEGIRTLRASIQNNAGKSQ
ncbi:hypothetical protein NLU13_9926 [Sarocladium strictum]|uniref:Sphingomyelin phosphodiesterase n=1 Tax=Sarocladium strictum TaxID=5046 RepID=A0AA39L3A1_SARSR|nr:hypothetical protein NLU13_9926 [Sarocladium strictum]